MPLITAFGRQGISEFENSQDHTENPCPPSPHSQIPHLQEKRKRQDLTRKPWLASMSQTSAALVLELKMCANIPNSFIESRWIYVPLKQDYIHMDIRI